MSASKTSSEGSNAWGDLEKTHDAKSIRDSVMDKNRQPGNSSFHECFGEVPENLDPLFSTHPSFKHSDFSLECTRMDDILAITPLYFDHGLWTLPPEL
jgi:hypothetical protein